MSNQIILWLMLVVPWLTFLFMKKEEVKRFMPSALFVIFLNNIIYLVGIYANFWYNKELAFPLMLCGVLPAIALWVLKIAYGHFWKYFTIKVAVFLIFSFAVIPWFGLRGMLGVMPYTNVIVFTISVLFSVVVYGYQKWQEKLILRKVNN